METIVTTVENMMCHKIGYESLNSIMKSHVTLRLTDTARATMARSLMRKMVFTTSVIRCDHDDEYDNFV